MSGHRARWAAASPARGLLGAAAGHDRHRTAAAQGNGLTSPVRCPALARGAPRGHWPLLDGRGHLHHGATMAAELMGPSIIAAIEVQCIPPVSPSVLLVIVT